MKKLFLLIIAIAFIFMGCVTTNEPTATTVVEEAVVENQETPEEIEAERREELLSNTIAIDAESPNINGIELGATVDEMIASITSIDTLLSVWFPTYGYYELDERPGTAYYGFENTAFFVKGGVVDGMSAISSKYNFMGLMVGDSAELIEPIMGEPDRQWELLIPRYYEYNMGAYFVVIEVAKGDDVIREIAFGTEARER